MAKKVYVDTDECTGCEVCVQACPAVFQMNDDGVAEVKSDAVPPGSEESCRTAADDCPSEAITIEE